MRSSAGRAIFFSCLLLVLLLNATSVYAADVLEFQFDSTDLQVYRDGLVHVTQNLVVNETLPVFSFSLLGSLVDNLVVLDENQTVLDYELATDNLTVFSLGATTVSVEYDTHSLTSKEAEVWTFLVDSPYNLTVVLPEDSTIVYLNGVPASIDTNGNMISVSLVAGFWEISYTFPLISPASFMVSNLDVSPAEIKPNDEVTVSVTLTNIGGQTGSYNVPLVVNQILEDTQFVTLNKDESTTVQFELTKQNLGTYTIDVDGLVQSFLVTENPVNNNGDSSGDSNSFPFEYLVVVAAVVIAIVAVFFIFRRKGPNVNEIFEKNPQLNLEEKNVIQFLADNKGHAFESQIRKKFPDIPRTSLWRLVKRLERLEIVNVEKIGLENKVELK